MMGKAFGKILIPTEMFQESRSFQSMEFHMGNIVVASWGTWTLPVPAHRCERAGLDEI